MPKKTVGNLEKLRRCDEHLGIALAYLVDAHYIGNMRELRNLIKLKLRLEDIHRRVKAGRECETRKAMYR